MTELSNNDLLEKSDREFVDALVNEGRLEKGHSYYLVATIQLRRHLKSLFLDPDKLEEKSFTEDINNSPFSEESKRHIGKATRDFFQTIRESNQSWLDTKLFMQTTFGHLLLIQELNSKMEEENKKRLTKDEIQEAATKSLRAINLIREIAEQRVPVFSEQLLKRLRAEE